MCILIRSAPPLCRRKRWKSAAHRNERSYIAAVRRIVIAVNVNALVAEARKVDAVVEVAACVGDFVAENDPSFRLRGSGAAKQVARRMRAMIENVLPSLPEARIPAIRQQQELVDRTLETSMSSVKTWRLPGFPIYRGWEGRRGVSRELLPLRT